MRYVEGHWDFDGQNRVLAITIVLSPLWLLAFAYLTRSPFGGGMYEPTEAQLLAGQRVQLVIFALAGLLSVAGTVVLWRARSMRAAVGAMCLLTLPGLILIMLGPAVAHRLGSAADGRR